MMKKLLLLSALFTSAFSFHGQAQVQALAERRQVFVFVNEWSWDGDGVNEFMDYTNSAAFSFNTAGADQPNSMGAWVKADTYTTTFTIRSKGNLTSREYYLQITSTGRVRGGYSSPTGLAEIIAQSSSTYLTDAGAWHWYGMTYSGSETYAGITLYRDGVAISTTDQSSGAYTGMTPGSGDPRMGIFFNSAANCADGKIFNPFLLNVEASAAQMLDIYQIVRGNLTAITSLTGDFVTVNYFPNGQDDFPTMYDYSGNSRDAFMEKGEATDINTDVP